LIDAIHELRWSSLPGIYPRNRALCDIAYKLSATPTRVTAEDWEPLRTLGFDDQAILEVAHVIGIFNYLTRLADGLGLQVDSQVLEAARSKIPLKKE
jgi:uncharacterized peroxidase-related enzyme